MTPGETAMHKVLLPRWKTRQALVAVAIALVVWLLDSFGTVQTLDDLGYDACLRLTSTASTDPAHVLLVYVGREQFRDSADAPLALVRPLLELGARAIGFTCRLSPPSAELVQLAKETGNIVLAHPFHANPASPDQLVLSSVAGDTVELPRGLVGLSPDSEGIYRSHFGSLPIDGCRRPSLEAVLARQVLLDGKTIPKGSFRVAFRGGSGSLPHVDHQSVVGGDLVHELVEGKVVLVGFQPEQAFPGISTPTTPGRVKMPLLEYHGHVLQTLLVAGPIHVARPLSRFFLFVVSAVVCVFVFQSVRLQRGLLVVVGVLLLDVAVALTLLGWLSLWIPCVPLALVQILCFAEVYQEKFRYCQQSVDGVLLDQSTKLRRRRIPTGFYATDDPWPPLTSLIYQQFCLNRLIVLERPADSDHLKEVHAVNCRPEDVEEKRRDCRRWPYSAAFESKLPLRVDTSGYSLLANQDPGEHQYLVRLAFGDDVLGFLVLGVAVKYLKTSPDFRLRLQSAADEVAVLLHRWRGVQSQRRGQQSWRGIISGIPEEESFRQLSRANHLLDNRLTRLEKTLESSGTAFAVYDLFGQLLMINGCLSQLLSEKGVVPRETSALDLLCSLTGRDVNSCRNLLQQTIGDKRSSSMTIVLDDPSRVFQMNICPLQFDAAPATVLPEEAYPFQLHGIHIELVDGMPFVEMQDIKGHITDRLCDDLSKNLDEVHRLVAQLAHDDELPERFQYVGETVEENLVDAVTALHQCQGFIHCDLVREPGQCVPIDASVALRRAVDAIEPVGDRQLDVRLMLPDVVGDVLASPPLIQSVFSAVLELLVSRATTNTTITVRAEESIGDISFVLETANASTSADQLRKVLIDDEETCVGELRQMREACNWVDQWGGRLVVSARDNGGIAIKLVLKRHHWLSDPHLASSEQTKETGTQK